MVSAAFAAFLALLLLYLPAAVLCAPSAGIIEAEIDNAGRASSIDPTIRTKHPQATTSTTSSTMTSLSSAKALNAAISLRGYSALVVGGTSGIGRGIALRLAQANASVTVMGRDAAAGASIVQEMQSSATADETGARPAFSFVSCDASLVRTIKSTVDTYTASAPKLDLLVLTQGIATLDGFAPTAEGLDRKLAVHYFGRAAFMHSLAPFMSRTSRSPVIMSVLSGGVHSPFAGYRSDFEVKNTYSLKNAADAAGMYNDIAVDMVSRENPDVRTIHSAPGVVSTNWGSDFPAILRYPVQGLMAILGQSPADCAEVQLAPIFKYLDDASKAPADFKKGGFAILKQGEVAPVTPLHAEASEFVWTQTKELFKKLM